LLTLKLRSRGSAVGLGTMLQSGRSRVRVLSIIHFHCVQQPGVIIYVISWFMMAFMTCEVDGYRSFGGNYCPCIQDRWRWRQYFASKHWWTSTRIHCVIIQKTTVWTL
jgi:phage shock protein PspC (stress-responsive transcriptional regulator)